MRLIGRGKQAQVYVDNGVVLWVANQREAHKHVTVGWQLCMERLHPPHFPKVLEIAKYDKDRCVWMELVQGKVPKVWRQAQADAILSELKAAHIWHRDVRLCNLRESDGVWCLIDFGWACDYRTPYPAPWYLGAEGRKARGVQDDVYAMSVIKKRLTSATPDS